MCVYIYIYGMSNIVPSAISMELWWEIDDQVLKRGGERELFRLLVLVTWAILPEMVLENT